MALKVKAKETLIKIGTYKDNYRYVLAYLSRKYSNHSGLVQIIDQEAIDDFFSLSFSVVLY